MKNNFLSKKTKYHFEDYSNKLLSKINIVNKLTSKEIYRLNDSYQKNGLYIKQVLVDNLGNIIPLNNDMNSKKRQKRPLMTLKEFYNKYYFVTNFNKIKRPKKLIKNAKKKKKAKTEINEESLENSENDESTLDEEYFLNLKQNLHAIYNDIQNIEYKDCKITDNDFKYKIIDYILKFKSFLTTLQYNHLVNKWKNELMKIKGVNILDQDSLDNFYNWRTSILKGLKSEIVLIAMTNSFRKKAGEEIRGEEEDNINKVEEKKKEIDSDSSDSDLDSNIEDEKEKNEINDFNELKKEENGIGDINNNIENNKKIIEDDDNDDIFD